MDQPAVPKDREKKPEPSTDRVTTAHSHSDMNGDRFASAGQEQDRIPAPALHPDVKLPLGLASVISGHETQRLGLGVSRVHPVVISDFFSLPFPCCFVCGESKESA